MDASFLEIPTTTLIVEQIHATCKALQRFHPEYEILTVCERGLVLMVNKCLPRPSDLEKKIASLREKLARLDNRNPRKCRGHSLYVKDIMEVLTDRLAIQPDCMGDTPYLKAMRMVHTLVSSTQTSSRKSQPQLPAHEEH